MSVDLVYFANALIVDDASREAFERHGVRPGTVITPGPVVLEYLRRAD